MICSTYFWVARIGKPQANLFGKACNGACICLAIKSPHTPFQNALLLFGSPGYGVFYAMKMIIHLSDNVEKYITMTYSCF